MDTIALVDKYPEADERVIAHEIVRSLGGPAAVAAIALARQGIQTSLVGTIGDDADGNEILHILKRENVDTSGITKTSEATSGSVIVVSKSEKSRAISTRQPISQIKPSESAIKSILNASWLHVDHVGIKQLDAIGISRGSGPKISFDAGYGVKDFDAKKVDLFAPNDRQMLERYPDKSAEQATKFDSEQSQNIVATTMGSKGSVAYSSADGLVKADPIKGEILSTLGAGDVFHGALLSQLIKGFNLEEALYRANVIAGLSCRGLDGVSMIPTSVELENYLKGAAK